MFPSRLSPFDAVTEQALLGVAEHVGQPWLFPPLTVDGVVTYPFSRWDHDVSGGGPSPVVGAVLGVVTVSDDTVAIDWRWADLERDDPEYPMDNAPWASAFADRPAYEQQALTAAALDASGAVAANMQIDRPALLAAALPEWVRPTYADLGQPLGAAGDLERPTLDSVGVGAPAVFSASPVLTSKDRLHEDAPGLQDPAWTLTAMGLGDGGSLDLTVLIGADGVWSAIGAAGDSVVVSEVSDARALVAHLTAALGRTWPDAAPFALSLSRGEAAALVASADLYRRHGEAGLQSATVAVAQALRDAPVNSVSAAAASMLDADAIGDGPGSQVTVVDDHVRLNGAAALAAAGLSQYRAHVGVELRRGGELVHRYVLVDGDRGMWVFTDTASAVGGDASPGVEVAAVGTAAAEALLADLVGL